MRRKKKPEATNIVITMTISGKWNLLLEFERILIFSKVSLYLIIYRKKNIKINNNIKIILIRFGR